MKKFTLAVIGIQKHWSNSELVRVLSKRTGWDEQHTRDYLSKNESIAFQNLEPIQICRTLDELETLGFEISLIEGYGNVRASITLADVQSLLNIKNEVSRLCESVDNAIKALNQKINQIQANNPTVEVRNPVRLNSVYRRLTEISTESAPIWGSDKKPAVRPSAAYVASPEPVKKSVTVSETKRTTESDIGKYWLSRIGIFTLLLGIVFLITYTSQFMGAWGKLSIGAILGLVLVGTGNYLAASEKYRKWAMSSIGGGWAILYFTVFAAYHVPMVKVIHSPALGFALMLVAACAFIAQSFRYESRALAFMSYFLAFFATTSTDIGVYTLVANYLLGISVVIVNRKLGWSWLAVLCLTAVYGIHWLWLEPSIYGMKSLASTERLWGMLILPWAGGEWQVYPVIDQAKSLLHLAFLGLYWMLFTSMTIFRSKNDKDETLSSSLAIINSLIFIFCFMHHLHLYYPAVKWIFAAVMGVVFLGLSFFENSRNQKHQSDIHLVFSVSLLCMIIPMYFDGSSITYGWSAASVAVMWLGFKHSRYVLRVIGWVLAGLVLFRLVSFDFLDREIIYRGIVTINPFFFVGAFSAAAFFLLHRFYLRSSKLESSVRTNWSNTALITSACVLGSSFLIGGLTSVSSTALMGIGIYLFCSCAVRKSGVMYVGLTFIAFSVLRLLGIDFEYSLASAKSDVSLYLRFATGAISTMSVLMLSEWTRRRYLDLSFKNWLFPSFAIAGALLLAALVSDELTKSFMAMMWGAMAFGFIVCGFSSREKVYRWIGLSLFLLVLIRLFAYDFANMQVIYKIISFIGLGVVFIVAGFIYNYYSKLLLPEAPKNKLEGLI